MVWSQDWETQNFGIRTFHKKDDLSDRVTIDENAPKIERTKKRHRFIPKKPTESRRNGIRQLPSREEESSSVRKEVRGRRRGHIRKPQSSPSRGLDIGEDKKSSSLIPTKPNFADFKQSFMEKSLLRHSQEINENQPPMLHPEKVSFYYFRKLHFFRLQQLRVCFVISNSDIVLNSFVYTDTDIVGTE